MPIFLIEYLIAYGIKLFYFCTPKPTDTVRIKKYRKYTLYFHDMTSYLKIEKSDSLFLLNTYLIWELVF